MHVATGGGEAGSPDGDVDDANGAVATGGMGGGVFGRVVGRMHKAAHVAHKKHKDKLHAAGKVPLGGKRGK